MVVALASLVAVVLGTTLAASLRIRAERGRDLGVGDPDFWLRDLSVDTEIAPDEPAGQLELQLVGAPTED